MSRNACDLEYERDRFGPNESRLSAHGSCYTALGETCHKKAISPAFAINATACADKKPWRNSNVEKKDATMHDLKRWNQGYRKRARILATTWGRRLASCDCWKSTTQTLLTSW